jgi:hypothetical protein
MADLRLDVSQLPQQEAQDGKWRYVFCTASSSSDTDTSQLPFSEGDFVVLSLQGTGPALSPAMPAQHTFRTPESGVQPRGRTLPDISSLQPSGNDLFLNRVLIVSRWCGVCGSWALGRYEAGMPDPRHQAEAQGITLGWGSARGAL